MKKIIPLIAAGVAICSTAQAQYSDSFDSGAFGTTSFGTWSTVITGATAGTGGTGVTAQTFDGPESDFTQNASGLSIKMLNDSYQTEGDGTGQEVQLRFDLATAVVDGETLVVGFDFMSPNATLANLQVQSGTAKASNTSFYNGNGNFTNNNGTDNVNEYTSMLSDTWYHLDATFSPNGAAADVQTLTLTEYNIAGNIVRIDNLTTGVQTDKESYNSLLFAWNVPNASKGGEYYIDNLNISVIPEPGTYALIASALALGAVMLRRRRS